MTIVVDMMQTRIAIGNECIVLMVLMHGGSKQHWDKDAKQKPCNPLAFFLLLVHYGLQNYFLNITTPNKSIYFLK